MTKFSKEYVAKMEAQETEDTKTCRRCGEVKPLHMFHFKANGRKLAAVDCIACTKKSKKGKEILYLYGLTLLQYDLMLKTQGGGCKICGKKTPKGQGRFHVDHDHKTGKIRGLLCQHCNIMLGLGQDDPKILVAAAHYLNAQANKE